MKRIAIIGGGLSGVAAAYQLAQESAADFTLFESSTRLGGIVETIRRDGFVIECGPDSWVTEKPWARELAVELGLEAEIIASNDLWRRTYLLDRNRLVPIPDGMRMMVPTQWAPVLNSPLFSWQARLGYLREFRRAEELKQAALADGADESVATFVSRHFGREVAETVAGPLLAGVFGGSIDTLSVRAVMPAFVKLERDRGSLIAALQKRESLPASVFTSLKSGLETLIERIASTLPRGAVRLEHDVRSVSLDAAQWRVEAPGFTGVFDAVILATPAHVTRRLLTPLHSEFESLLNMDATSAIVVALAFSAEHAARLRIPRGFGYLVPQKPQYHTAVDQDPQLLACTFVDQKFAHRAPHGAILLRGFFGGETAPALLGESDASIIAIAHRRLSQALGPLPEPRISLVRRWPLSLPQYAVGHLDRMANLTTLVQNFPGLYLVGNAYYGVGLPDLIREGRDAARRASRA
ncbi:MAG TPA: protoporphyrinogen oxidase [Bryobacteraceae bacterium]|nr:protoporphyrinogen oxidase [Bryobacteraceae bacterium]